MGTGNGSAALVWCSEPLADFGEPIAAELLVPTPRIMWYGLHMRGTYPIVVGDRGRIVVPVEVRERSGIREGTQLILLDTPDGLVLLTREQLRARVRNELTGLDLVTELLTERRQASEHENAQ